MEEELALLPCPKCGLLPYIVEDPILGYTLKHNPQCEVIPQLTTCTDAPIRAAAMYELITAWNAQVNSINEEEA